MLRIRGSRRSVVTILIVCLALSAAATAQESTAPSEPIDHWAGIEVAEAISQSTGIAISPLLGVGALGVNAGLASILAGGLRFDDGLQGGSFVDNNDNARAMIIPLPIVTAQNADLVFGGLVASRLIGRLRTGFLVSVPLAAFAAISTFSRGSFLALCAMAFTMVLFRKRRIRWALGLTATAAVVLGIGAFPSGYLERLASIEPSIALEGQPQFEEQVEFEGASAAGRLHFWGVATDMVRDWPLGVGVMNYQNAYSDYDPSGGQFGMYRAVHSSHFQVLSEQRWVGAAVWVLLFAWSCRIMRRVRRCARTPGMDPALSHLFTTAPVALIASMVGFVTGGSFISLARNDLTWITFALVAAVDRVSASTVLQESQQHQVAPEPGVVRRRVPFRPRPRPSRLTGHGAGLHEGDVVSVTKRVQMAVPVQGVTVGCCRIGCRG